MVIVFSICSFIYAAFYGVIMASDININYVEDILSLNIQKFKDSGTNLGEEGVEIEDKSYQIKQVR